MKSTPYHQPCSEGNLGLSECNFNFLHIDLVETIDVFPLTIPKKNSPISEKPALHIVKTDKLCMPPIESSFESYSVLLDNVILQNYYFLPGFSLRVWFCQNVIAVESWWHSFSAAWKEAYQKTDCSWVIQMFSARSQMLHFPVICFKSHLLAPLLSENSQVNTASKTSASTVTYLKY